MGSGAKPIGMVDHLQFGNPEDPEIFWTFIESIEGIADYAKLMKSIICSKYRNLLDQNFNLQFLVDIQTFFHNFCKYHFFFAQNNKCFVLYFHQ